jgi:hypothetical protein
MSHVCLPDTHSAPHIASLTARLVRVGWMVVGHGLLLLVAVQIAVSRQGFFTEADLAFWLTVASLLGLRYLDITRFHGQTVTGEPATLSHWRDYAVVAVMFSLGLWLLSHGLAMLAGLV